MIQSFKDKIDDGNRQIRCFCSFELFATLDEFRFFENKDEIVILVQTRFP